MARDDWRRRREREDEADAEITQSKEITRTATRNIAIEKMVDNFERAEALIEQLNNLYNQYVAGVERLPPNERRKQLDQTMASLATVHKPTAAYLYRYNNLQSRYIAYRDRWDKLLKDLESGKIKRITGPMRGR